MSNNQLRYILLFFIVVVFQTTITAQEDTLANNKRKFVASPVIIETIIGNNGVNIQSVFSKKFTPTSRFGIFGIVDMYGVYDTKIQEIRNQQMAQTQITFAILKGLDISAGAFFEKYSGFRPTIGLQYNLFAGDFHLLLAPRIDLSQTYNGEAVGFLEYTPKIKNEWRVYSRVQRMYNWDFKNRLHNISYLRGRLGASYQIYRFGLGANFNHLGPQKIREHNYGLFIEVLLF